MSELYFLPNTFMSIHTGVILSKILEQRESQSDEVLISSCVKGVSTCAFNITSSKLKCFACRSYLKTLSIDYNLKNIQNVDLKSAIIEKEYQILQNINNASSMHEIKKIKYDEAFLGYAIVSSFISKFRSTTLDRYAIKCLQKLAISYMRTYEGLARNLRDNKKIKKLVIFNGRFELANAAMEAARVNGIEVEIMEVTGVGSKIISFGPYSPFSLNNVDSLIKKYWKIDSKNHDSITEAHIFYRKKINGDATNDVSYTSLQEKESRPKGWKREDIIKISIFGSSMDEFFSINPDWEFDFFKSQADGVKIISNIVNEERNIMIYYRMHPNLKYLRNNEISEELALSKLSNVQVIEPESSVSTYGMLLESDIVISFGSSVGIEAVYHKKRAILIGKSVYMNLPNVCVAKSHDELKTLLSDVITQVKHDTFSARDYDNSASLMYSNYLIRRGYESNIFKIIGGYSSVNNKIIRPGFLGRLCVMYSGIFEVFLTYNSLIIRLRRSQISRFLIFNAIMNKLGKSR